MKPSIIILITLIITCSCVVENEETKTPDSNNKLVPYKSKHIMLNKSNLDSLAVNANDSSKLPRVLQENPKVLDSLYGFSLVGKYRFIGEEKIEYCTIYKEYNKCLDKDKNSISIKNSFTDTNMVYNIDTENNCLAAQHFITNTIIRHQNNLITIDGTGIERFNCDSLHLYKGHDKRIKFVLSFFNTLNNNGITRCHTNIVKGKFTLFNLYNSSTVLYIPDEGQILDDYIDGRILFKVQNNTYLLKR